MKKRTDYITGVLMTKKKPQTRRAALGFALPTAISYSDLYKQPYAIPLPMVEEN